MTPPRVVLDTNVVISALVFAGRRLEWMRDAWASARITPLISRAVAAELIRVLEYPRFRLSAGEREILLGDYLPVCEVVRVARTTTALIPECRDPDDRIFLELALAGKADFLVTGDADLLSLAARFSVPIVTAERLRVRIEGGLESTAGERAPARYTTTRGGNAKARRRAPKTRSRAMA